MHGRLLAALAALTALTALLVPATATAAAVPDAPLRTDGARIVDAGGKTAILQGVNWFGFETQNHVAHGLWTRDYKDMLAQIRRQGFNTIRLPFSIQAMRAKTMNGIDFGGGRNAALRDKTPLEALEVIVAEARRHDLLVLLDNHSLADDGFTYDLWYGQGGYDEDDWVNTWRSLAERFDDDENVIGADLKNEPHGRATWGTGGSTDWRRAAERAGDAVLERAPHWLVVVEGIEGPVAGGQQLDRHWWGGNLEGVRRHPVRLDVDDRVVYSPHEYGPGVYAQPWFSDPNTTSILADRWRKGFGYIAEAGIAPILVGEFGGKGVGRDTVEGRWQRQFMDHIGVKGYSWTYWAWNPNSGDTGGVLMDDWTTINAGKMGLLRALIGRDRIDYTAGPGTPAPTPATSPSPTPTPTPTPTPAPGPPTAGSLTQDSRWETGACYSVNAASRTTTFTVPGGMTITSTWNGAFSGTTGRVTVALPDWARFPSRDAGFCASGAAPSSPAPQPQPQPQPTPPPATGGALIEQSRWPTGACYQIRATAPSVSFQLPAGERAGTPWNASLSAATGTITATFPSWMRFPSTDAGFCVSR